MGSNSSKHSTKDEREEIRKVAVQTQINKIDNIKTSLNDTTNSVMKKSDMDAIMKMTTIAKTQLERDDKPLTKTDLIAILIKIKTLSGNIKNSSEANKMVEECNKYTVGDINAMIRCVVFDVNLPGVNTSNSSSITNGNNSTLPSITNGTNNTLQSITNGTTL